MCAENVSESSPSQSHGIVFHQEPIVQEEITFKREVSLKGTGIELLIPDDDSKFKESLIVTVRTCLSGPFELPEDYEPASPAYSIQPSRRVKFQKAVTVKIHHYASLESEEDCDDMVFLSARFTPKYRESRPVFVFKEIKGAKGVFKTANHVGEIKLSHFCLIRAAKRKRSTTSKGKYDVLL